VKFMQQPVDQGRQNHGGCGDNEYARINGVETCEHLAGARLHGRDRPHA